ncbi:MAG: hypothetical protein AAF403_08950, partial [Pseudomonadota bacterium]
MIRFDKSPIDTIKKLQDFTQTRASYIAQTSLYGYLKTRMGTNYRTLFEDDVFSSSIRLSAAKIFTVALSDLCLFSGATIVEYLSKNQKNLDIHVKIEDSAYSICLYCFYQGFEKGLQDFDDLKPLNQV